MRSLFVLASVLGLTVYGQLIIKARALLHSAASADVFAYIAAMATDLRVLSGLAAAALAAGVWITVVQKLDVGFGYSFMAVSFVLVPLDAKAIFGEPLLRLQILGMFFIVVGVTFGALSR